MVDADSIINSVIGITISLIIMAVLLPIGLQTFLVDGNWSNITGLDDTVVTMLTVLVPIIVVLAIVLLFLGMIKIRRKNN